MMARKVYAYKIDIESQASTKALAELELQLFEVNKAIRDAKKTGDTELYTKLRGEQLGLRNEIKDTKKELREQEKAFKAAKFPADSLIGLRQEYKKLKLEINALSKEAREAPEGIALIEKADSIKSKIKEIGASVGDFRENVGNYADATKNLGEVTSGLLGGNITSLLSGFVAGGGVVAAIDLLKEGVTVLADLTEEFTLLRDQVAQVTQLTGDSLDTASVRVQSIAKTFGQDVTELVLAANAAAEGFGITFDQALEGIETGLLSGANANGDFLELLKEYPTVLDNAGFSFQDFIKLTREQTQGGFFNDKLIDTVKEFDLAVKELTQTQLDALAPLGEEFVQDFGTRLAEGTLTSKEALFELSAAAKDAGLDLRQTQTITADLFKGAGEDAGGFEKVVGAVFDALETDYDSLRENLTDYQQRQEEVLQANRRFAEAQKDLNEVLEPLIGNVETARVRFRAWLLESIVPAIEFLQEMVQPIRDAIAAQRQFVETIGLNTSKLREFNPILNIVRNTFTGIGIVLKVVGTLAEQGANAMTAIAERVIKIRDNVTSTLRQLGILRTKQRQEEKEDIEETNAQIESQADAQGKVGKAIEETGESMENAEKKASASADALNHLGRVADALAETSLAFLSKRVSELNRELSETAGPDEYIAKLEEIKEAETALQIAQQTRQVAVDRARDLFSLDDLDPTEGIAGQANIKGEDTAEEATQQILIDTDLENRAELEQEKQIQEKLLEVRKAALESRAELEKSARDDRLKEEEENLKKQQELIKDFSGQFSELIASFATGQIKTFEDFSKQLLQLALDTTEKTILLSIAEITGKQIASKGFAGIATAAVLTGVVKGLFAAAKGAVQQFAEGGIVRLPGYENGGLVNTRPNIPTQANGDDVFATLRVGEVVLNDKQIKAGRRIFGNDFLKMMGVPGFASGGLVLPTPQFIARPGQQNSDVGFEGQALERQASIIGTAVSQAVKEGVRQGIQEAEERREEINRLNKRRSF